MITFYTLLTSLFCIQIYCSATYSRIGVNLMCILKTSKELIENLMSQDYLKLTALKRMISQQFIQFLTLDVNSFLFRCRMAKLMC
jgi:hypothetical protein